MTVQELIKELEKIEDKSKRVIIYAKQKHAPEESFFVQEDYLRDEIKKPYMVESRDAKFHKNKKKLEPVVCIAGWPL